ncbi:odorant receptor 33a isoform X3 [Monomorium pharaonis]|uniref:odorant receptor 33a isoform X3 n=1 Tax=Monomorium pharaonis TaxID=307658 RepID=UPI00174770EA|nr:odorant receptor 33a isoform X3 [Monomorium pharaonis]
MLVSLTFSIFTNCYVGQLLTDQSSKFGLMASTMNWYRLPHKRTRSLILIMAISNIPAKISAGKLIDMSLLTFSNCLSDFIEHSITAGTCSFIATLFAMAASKSQYKSNT